MEQNLYKEITAIEDEAEKIISDAEKESSRIIKQANEDGFKLKAEKEYELKELKANTINAVLAEAARLRETKLEENRKEIERIGKSAEKKKTQAETLILKKLFDLIGE